MAHLSYLEFTDSAIHGGVVLASTTLAELHAAQSTTPRLRVYIDDAAEHPTPSAVGALLRALRDLARSNWHNLTRRADGASARRYFGYELRHNRLREVPAAALRDTLRAHSVFQPHSFVVVEVSANGSALARLLDMAAIATGEPAPSETAAGNGVDGAAPPADAAEQEQRARIARRKELLDEGWPTSAQIAASQRGSVDPNPSYRASRLRVAKRLLGVWSTQDRTFRHPTFQFDDTGQLRSAVAELLAILPIENDDSGWQRALWLHEAHPLLNQRTPAEVFVHDPQRVIAVVREQFPANALQQQDVDVDLAGESTRMPADSIPDEAGEDKIATIILSLRIENNSQFVRGKKRVRENVEMFHLEPYDAVRLPSGDYMLKVPYQTDEELDETIRDLLGDIEEEADMRHCFTEADAYIEGTDRHW